ncbi:hypothetical protein Tco_1186613 [Tanacetum coccineum]
MASDSQEASFLIKYHRGGVFVRDPLSYDYEILSEIPNVDLVSLGLAGFISLLETEFTSSVKSLFYLVPGLDFHLGLEPLKCEADFNKCVVNNDHVLHVYAYHSEVDQPLQEMERPLQDVVQPLQEVGRPLQGVDSMGIPRPAWPEGITPEDVKIHAVESQAQAVIPLSASQPLASQEELKDEELVHVERRVSKRLKLKCFKKKPELKLGLTEDDAISIE